MKASEVLGLVCVLVFLGGLVVGGLGVVSHLAVGGLDRDDARDLMDKELLDVTEHILSVTRAPSSERRPIHSTGCTDE